MSPAPDGSVHEGKFYFYLRTVGRSEDTAAIFISLTDLMERTFPLKSRSNMNCEVSTQISPSPPGSGGKRGGWAQVLASSPQ